jgi:3-oxoacyl-(acyl-carrier-protein) synthase/acyl carrier protein
MNDQAIAVIGMSCRLPGARDPQSLWLNLLQGKVCSTRYDAAQLRRMGVSEALIGDPRFVPVDARLIDADQFDPEFFAMSQREAELLDPQHRLMLECAWELTQTTGLANPMHRPRIGLFAGCSMNTYHVNVIGGECDLMSATGTERMLANDKDYMTARVSYKLGLDGPSICVQTGCSSSLTAVHLAVNSLLLGECEVAFAGGVSFHALARPGYLYQPDLMFSRDGTCRPFDAQASGTFFGDGVGLVALRPLEDAMLAGDSIQAVILGSAANNDGAGRAGFTAPGVDGQQQLILQAQALAQVHPETLGMVEAHGTGTQLGDPVEFDALCRAFAQQTDRRAYCALGSVKANLGHLAAAAGFAGLARAVLSLRHACIPPHPSFTRANPACELERSPFMINTQPLDWHRAEVRRAGLSSFGAGGSNVHMVLEQAPPRPVQVALGQPQSVVLSGRDEQAVDALVDVLHERIAREPELMLEEVARGLAEGRAHLPWRTTIFAADAKQLGRALGSRSFNVARVDNEPRTVRVVVNDELLQTLALEPAYQGILEQLREQTPVHSGVTEPERELRITALIQCLRRLLPGHLLAFALDDRDAAIAERLRLDDGDLVGAERMDLQICGTSLGAWLGRFWSLGGQVDWTFLRAGRRVLHQELPFAPLRPRRCWYSRPSVTEHDRAPAVYVEQWRQQGRLSGFASTIGSERLQILGGDSDLRVALQDSLESLGQLVVADAERGLASERVIWLLQGDSSLMDDPAFSWQLCETIKQFIEQGCQRLELALVGAGFVDPLVCGNVKAGLSAALACVAAIGHEHPGIRIKVVDVPSALIDGPRQAKVLAQMLVRLHSLPKLCALREGRIWTRAHDVLEQDAGEVGVAQPLVCLVTGGLGTVGFGMASYLARHLRADLVLVQRPGADNSASQQERLERLQALRDMGARVDVVLADVTDRDALFSALTRLQATGVKPNAFVHAAGLSGNRTQQWLLRSTQEQWQRLMAPKWQGACLLHEWFTDQPLRFGCFVSSLAVLAGGLGLGPYAAANEACAYWSNRCTEQTPYFAIDWDGWEGWEHSEGMRYAEGRSSGLVQREVDLLLDSIFAALGRYSRFVISSSPLASRLQHTLQADKEQTVELAQESQDREACDVERMKALWQDVLRCAVSVDANFFDLGGDSLVGAELIRLVNARFAVSLSMIDLFESSSVQALARQVLARQCAVAR